MIDYSSLKFDGEFIRTLSKQKSVIIRIAEGVKYFD